MSNVLSWDFARDGLDNRLHLKGAITEETNFGPLLEEIDSRPLVIDLGGITRINSCGVREWMEFVAALNGRGVNLVFERCSPLIVTQLNLISNFAGRDGEVRSVLAPYFCPSCDDEHLKLVDLTKGDVQLEEFETCPRCGSQMEFDDIPEAFLDFRDSPT